jgi:hypothetical protein
MGGPSTLHFSPHTSLQLKVAQDVGSASRANCRGRTNVLQFRSFHQRANLDSVAAHSQPSRLLALLQGILAPFSFKAASANSLSCRSSSARNSSLTNRNTLRYWTFGSFLI